MRGFVLAVVGFLLHVARGFVERVLHFGIGFQSQRALPFGDGGLDAAQAVVGPAAQLRDFRRIGRDAEGVIQIVERLGIFAALQVQISGIEQQGKIVRCKKKRLTIIVHGLIELAMRHLELRDG